MDNTKNTYHHENLRKELVDQACLIISQEGVKHLTMRELSKDLGVSRTAAYRHFENKFDLLCACAEKGFFEIARIYKNITDKPALDPVKTLEKLGRAYVDFGLKNPSLYRLMFGSSLTVNDRPESLRISAHKAFEKLLITVGQCQKNGAIAYGNPQAVASVLWSLMHGVTSLLIDGQLQTSEQKEGVPVFLTANKGESSQSENTILDLAVEVILKGLA